MARRDLRPAVRALALLNRSLERALDDLSLPQYRVLAIVAGGDALASRVATRLAVAKPTVTAVVDGLVERGLLERAPVPEDRRAMRLVVTASGRRALARAELEMSTRLESVLDDESLAADLARLLERVDERVRARISAKAATAATGGGSRTQRVDRA